MEEDSCENPLSSLQYHTLMVLGTEDYGVARSLPKDTDTRTQEHQENGSKEEDHKENKDISSNILHLNEKQTNVSGNTKKVEMNGQETQITSSGTDGHEGSNIILLQNLHLNGESTSVPRNGKKMEVNGLESKIIYGGKEDDKHGLKTISAQRCNEELISNVSSNEVCDVVRGKDNSFAWDCGEENTALQCEVIASPNHVTSKQEVNINGNEHTFNFGAGKVRCGGVHKCEVNPNANHIISKQEVKMGVKSLGRSSNHPTQHQVNPNTNDKVLNNREVNMFGKLNEGSNKFPASLEYCSSPVPRLMDPSYDYVPSSASLCRRVRAPGHPITQASHLTPSSSSSGILPSLTPQSSLSSGSHLEFSSSASWSSVGSSRTPCVSSISSTESERRPCMLPHSLYTHDKVPSPVPVAVAGALSSYHARPHSPCFSECASSCSEKTLLGSKPNDMVSSSVSLSAGGVSPRPHPSPAGSSRAPCLLECGASGCSEKTLLGYRNDSAKIFGSDRNSESLSSDIPADSNPVYENPSELDSEYYYKSPKGKDK